MATKVKVTYVDGREVVVLVSPRAQVMAEEKFQGLSDDVAVRLSYYLAWASLHKAGHESADYETWLDLISDAEPAESEPTDPTPGATPPLTESSG